MIVKKKKKKKKNKNFDCKSGAEFCGSSYSDRNAEMDVYYCGEISNVKLY